MTLAFSTCWNSARHTRGDQMLEEIFLLGINRIELGHGIRLSLWEGIEQFLADHPVTLTSLHNFCPLPIEVPYAAPDCYQCTSPRVEERQRCLRHTLQTIDYAQKLGANRVVMHLGSAPIPDYTGRLVDRIKSGHYLDRRYVALKLKAIREREAKSVFDRVFDWLQPVVAHAAEAGVKLGIENRIGIETFPSEREFAQLFAQIPNGSIGYWHDFGHAQVRHNLTFIDHAEWLNQMRPHLLGCHVHDVKFPDQDHQVPFSGMIELEPLIRSIDADIPFVWELSSKVSKDEIVAALAHWQQRFG